MNFFKKIFKQDVIERKDKVIDDLTKQMGKNATALDTCYKTMQAQIVELEDDLEKEKLLWETEATKNLDIVSATVSYFDKTTVLLSKLLGRKVSKPVRDEINDFLYETGSFLGEIQLISETKSDIANRNKRSWCLADIDKKPEEAPTPTPEPTKGRLVRFDLKDYTGQKEYQDNFKEMKKQLEANKNADKFHGSIKVTSKAGTSKTVEVKSIKEALEYVEKAEKGEIAVE